TDAPVNIHCLLYAPYKTPPLFWRIILTTPNRRPGQHPLPIVRVPQHPASLLIYFSDHAHVVVYSSSPASFLTDAPVNIRCLLYVPHNAPPTLDLSQDAETGVSLYSRRVMIQAHSKDILPRWLRFLKGVVDSEDVPLNLSRELLQQTAVIRGKLIFCEKFFL
uniref:Uncharacterized protein n=1 Tax=Romanomermis culicivorax TaxID=13658 RepID=A0A915HU19_ROMCU